MKKPIGILFSVFFLALSLTLAGCSSTSTSQTPGEYLDDSAITTKVKAAILNDPDVNVMEVSVETYDGDVQLSGFVSSEADATRAVQIARDVEGVKSVSNNMQLR